MRILVPLLLFLLPCASYADLMIGGEIVYSIRKGDCLLLIGARFGVDWQVIARENGLDPKKPCRVGTQLSINNRKIVPKVISGGILVNIPDRMLYFFKEGNLATAFPVGLGMPSKRWQTPTGSFVILYKEKNPTWHVPASIQKEMEKKGEPVKEVVPPGPDNPLGRYALHTSLPGVLIHETIWPTTVYQFRSHSCIRVLPATMETFFDEVSAGTTGEIIYEPVSVAVADNGRIFLQVDRDAYHRVMSMEEEVKARIEKRGFTDKVDWTRVESAIRKRSGIAEDVTR
jgi:L,D-transpeptidase ErfK/SrfK